MDRGGRTKHESLTIEPEPAAWGQHLKAAHIDDDARAVRAQLGLATDRAIVMTGHQPIAFHPGILAKYAAAQACGRAFEAQAVQLVADQDVVEPLLLRRCVPGADGVLTEETVSLGGSRGGDIPEGMRAPAEVPPRDDAFSGFAEALAGNAWADSLAEQAAGGVGELLEPWIERTPMVFATRLRETERFNGLVDRMGDDPLLCAQAYNAALDEVGHTHTRRLEIEGGRVELPLWRVRRGVSRRGIFSGELAGIPRDEIAPKALTMTGFVRAWACDLFIHGTGGAAYDLATEAWFRDWLGIELCPAACVTATRLIDFGVPLTSGADVARAVQMAHHARHEPGLLGDGPAGARKRELVEQIARVRGDGGDASGLFNEMQALLGDVRTRHAGAIEQLQSKAEKARRDEAQSGLALDRTWSFVLHSEETIAGLVREIEAAFALVACGTIKCS